MQDTWPAVPFREWTPVCGAVPPLVSMFRHRDVLVPGCALRGPCSSRCLSARAQAASHSQHSHSPGALRTSTAGWSVPQSKPKHAPWAQQFCSGSSLCWAELSRTTCPKCSFTPAGQAPAARRAEDVLVCRRDSHCPLRSEEDWVLLWAFDPILTSNR